MGSGSPSHPTTRKPFRHSSWLESQPVLPGSVRLFKHPAFGGPVWASPRQAVNVVLPATDRERQRQWNLPTPSLVYCVMVPALFRMGTLGEVWRGLAEGLYRVRLFVTHICLRGVEPLASSGASPRPCPVEEADPEAGCQMPIRAGSRFGATTVSGARGEPARPTVLLPGRRYAAGTPPVWAQLDSQASIWPRAPTGFRPKCVVCHGMTEEET